MPIPTSMEAQFDERLSTFSIGWRDDNANRFVAGRSFPVVNVNKQSATYKVFPLGYFLQDQVEPRPEGGVPQEIFYRTRTQGYYCEEEGLRAKVDKNEVQNYGGPGDLRRNKINLLTHQHEIHKERKWATEFMVPDKWSTSLTGVAGAPAAGQFQQFDQANLDLGDYIDGQKDAMALRTGIAPNFMVIGRRVRRAFRKNPLFRDAIKYTQGGVLSLEIVAGLLDLDEVVSPIGVYNRARGEILDPATGLPIVREDYSFIVGERDALLMYRDETANSTDAVTGGAHFAWTGLLGDGAFNSVVNRGTWDYGEWFDVLQAFTPNVVAPDLGMYFAGAVA